MQKISFKSITNLVNLEDITPLIIVTLKIWRSELTQRSDVSVLSIEHEEVDGDLVAWKIISFYFYLDKNQ